MKQEPYRLHAAIFNSLRTLDGLGANNELVLSVEGHYSRNLQSAQKKTGSPFIDSVMVNMTEMVQVRWHCDCVQNAVTVREILDNVYNIDGIPDVILQKITFAMPHTFYNSNNYRTEKSWLEWVFSPYTFRRGIWERLKATEFPGQKLYIRYTLLRKELSKTLDKETAKRWRDTLMMNRPNPSLDNDEIRGIWSNKQWALLLKETTGNFDLMNMSESR